MGFFKENPNHVRRYNYEFDWGHLHRTPEQLQKLIHTYDDIASDALDALSEIEPSVTSGANKKGEDTDRYSEKRTHRDLYTSVQEHATTDARVKRLLDEITRVPSWVDWDSIERGQKILWRYGGPAITALTFLSLVGGMGSGRTVETLDRTGGFDARVVRQRLLETTQHTLDVHRDLSSIKYRGDGFESSVRVRLLHASVRRRIMKLAESNPGYYNLSEHGIPANDLDCIGTISTFSSTLIWIGFPRQGIWLRQQEIVDYLALWRYVAYLMGTPHDWMETPETAKAMMESLLVSEIRPTEKSAILANNIITGLEGQPPTYASRGFLNAETYWLSGNELAQALGVERPSLYHTALMAGQCLYFMNLAYVSRIVPLWDEANINLVRRVFYTILIHNKSKGGLGYRTNFQFKWIPNLNNRTTPLGGRVPGRAQTSGAFHHPGIERTALITLVITSSILLVIVGLIVKAFNVLCNGESIKLNLCNILAHVLGLARSLKN